MLFRSRNLQAIIKDEMLHWGKCLYYSSSGFRLFGELMLNGDNAIIAANAAVVKDVDEEAIVGGVPAVVIGHNDRYRLFNSD